MRRIERKIAIKGSISRCNGTVPGAIKIWRTPVGDFMSRKEAELAIMQTSYQLDTIKLDFTYGDIDIAQNPQGNYGLVPFNITESAMTGDSGSTATVPYAEIIEWYGFLKKYYETIGDDESAEQHYLLETSGENVSPQLLREAKEEDDKVKNINSHFANGDAKTWIEKNILGYEGNTTTTFGVVSNNDDVSSKGYFTLPILMTSNIDDMGQMTVFNDEHEPEDYHNSDEISDYRLGEVYNNITYVDEDKNLIQLNSDYIIHKFIVQVPNTADTGVTPVAVELTPNYGGASKTPSYSFKEFCVGKTKYEGNEAYVYAMKYYDWLIFWDEMYDIKSTDMASSDHSFNINSSPAYTTHDIDGNIVPFRDELSAEEYITKTYPLEGVGDYGFFVIKGNKYEVKYNRFVTLVDEASPFNGYRFPVYEIKKNASNDVILYYTIVNGRKYLGSLQGGAALPVFYFEKPNGCDKGTPSIVDEFKTLYIEYEDAYIPLDSATGDLQYQTVTLEDTAISGITNIKDVNVYRRLRFYTSIDGEIYYVLYKPLENERDTLYIITDDNISSGATGYTITQKLINKLPKDCFLCTVNIGEKTVLLTYNNVFEPTSLITGYTTSRLHMVRDAEIATDALGNQLPGIFEFDYDADLEKNRNKKFVNSKYNEPYDGMLLEIPYHIGNTNEIENAENMVIGDILSELFIIPYDADGNEVPLSVINDSDDDIDIEKNKFYASEMTLDDMCNRKLSETIIEPLFKSPKVSSVKLFVRYQIGAELRSKTFKDSTGTKELKLKAYFPRVTEGTLSAGVSYTEQFNLVEKTFKYYSDDDIVSVVRYYDLEPEEIREYINNDFENDPESEQQAKFSLAVNVFGRSGRYIWANTIPGTNSSIDGYKFDAYNGEMLSPTYRSETMFGISVPQNIDNNIYIDRGINALFEKQMKLNEAKTLDALTLYGNKYFNIDND